MFCSDRDSVQASDIQSDDKGSEADFEGEIINSGSQTLCFAVDLNKLKQQRCLTDQ